MVAGAVPCVRMPDGRELAFQSCGDPAGMPVFYFHGYPGSRLEGSMAAEAAARGGLHLVAIDRPGFGGSDPQPRRRILDWPNDVAVVADALGFDRFSVIGVSGGGPYAAATGASLPDRVSRIAIVCGVGPMHGRGRTRDQVLANRMLFGAARRAPLLLRLAMAVSARALRGDPDRLLRRLRKGLPEPDRLALGEPKLADLFVTATREAFRQGTAAAVQEGRLYVRPWGFRMEDVRTPVQLFQGEQDRNVPAWMGREQAERYPLCSAHFYPDEGHLSLVVNRQDEIMEVLRAG